MAKGCGDCGSERALTQAEVRAHIQLCGAGKNNQTFFAGIDFDEIQVTDSETFVAGERESIQRHDPKRPGKYYTKGFKETPPGDNTITVEFAECCGGIPQHELIKNRFTLYQMHVCCNTDPCDLKNGWKGGHLLVSPNIRIGSRRRNARTAFSDSNELTTTYSGTMDEEYRIGEMVGTDLIEGLGASRIRAAIMVGDDSCGDGDCGDKSESCTDRVYAIDITGNFICKIPGQPATLTPIPGLNGSPVSIFENDGYIYVYSSNGSYFYTQLDSSGKPTTWIQSGISATFANAIQCDRSMIAVGGLAGDAAIWQIGGAGATPNLIYQAPGTTPLNKAHCCGKTVVTVGDNGLILVSNDYGDTFSTAPTTPTTANIQAVWVHSEYSWDIGTITGEYWCTRDAGQTWQQISYGGQLPAILDITWLNDEIGTVSGVGGFYTTFTGGAQGCWVNGESARIRGDIPMVTATETIFPCCDNQTCAANNMLAAGYSGITGQLIHYQPA